jgi:sialate O-acetylesterase
MHRRTGVPQGLIATAHGGTGMEQWDPAKRSWGGESLYGSMLASLKLVGQPISGVLWYQGESDTNPTALPHYTTRMQHLVAAVRADQKQPRLPWIVAQIGRFINDSGQRYWNGIQEQERLLPKTIRQLDVVSTIDLELDDLIHISGKAYATLGMRMARAAARLALGDAREIPAIQPISAQILHGSAGSPHIEVRFANVVGGLQSTGLPNGFSFVDADHKPFDLAYKVVLDGDRAILELAAALERTDLRVMYGWGCNPHCTISDARGMAVPVFGPLRLANQHPTSPWFSIWDASAILPGENIGRLQRPLPKQVGSLTRTGFPPGQAGSFVNMHEHWKGHSGHVAFFADVMVSEAMPTELRIGYDGPFRLWLNHTEIHTDLKGTNPAIVDKHRLPLRLRPGRHRLTVLMALNRGLAWGFFLRFARSDVPEDQRDRGGFAMPIPAI